MVLPCHGTWSKLVQVMACCLTTPSHCLSAKFPCDQWVAVSGSNVFSRKQEIDVLVQERHNSSVLAMELHLSCTNPSKYQSSYVVSPQQRVMWGFDDSLILSPSKPLEEPVERPLILNDLAAMCPTFKHYILKNICWNCWNTMHATKCILSEYMTLFWCQCVWKLIKG